MSYLIDPHRPLTTEVRRIAAAEIDAALQQLAAARQNPDEALHECRKRLKSLRALFRLVRSGDDAFFRAENARYRDVAAGLAGPREAAALIETVDRLAKAFPDETASGELDPVRNRLVARRKGMLGEGAGAAINAAVASCKTGLRQIRKLKLPDEPQGSADILAEGMGKTIHQAHKTLASAKKRGEAEDFHALRKTLKAHSRHLSLLKKLWPSSVKARRKAIDALTERLGELHDIFVMRGLLKDKEHPLGVPAETRLLARLCKRSERQLRKACLAEAAELFRDSPKRSAKKVARKIRHDLAELQPAA
jgi:CHAD domain-containing protein